MREAVEIAADAETAIAGEIALVVIDRQSRQLDRQAAAVVDRPVDGDAGPGVACRNRFSDAAGGIEPEGLSNLVPGPSETGGRARADQPGEFIRAEEEAVRFIHLPGEAQRLKPRDECAFGRNLRCFGGLRFVSDRLDRG